MGLLTMNQLQVPRRMPFQAPHVAPRIRSATRGWHIARFSMNDFGSSIVTTAESDGPTGGPETLKRHLLHELEGLDRGIFGVPAAKRARILGLIGELEKHNPQPAPTLNPEALSGTWRLLYSTITITGAKRTKLGLREFVRLGEFTQHIDTTNNLAMNRIDFSVSGLSSIGGSLTIRARYQVASEQRVDITYLDSALTPSQLQKIFEANLDLLLSIFNPEGYLDITYLDLGGQAAEKEGDGASSPSSCWRVGRDDKCNVFLLQRAPQQ